MLVVHDEGDLELGRLQARLGGGLAGHNGLRSLAQHAKTQDFLRLRVGVGRPGRGDPRPLADWVLANFEPHEDVDELVARAAERSRHSSRAVSRRPSSSSTSCRRALRGRGPSAGDGAD